MRRPPPESARPWMALVLLACWLTPAAAQRVGVSKKDTAGPVLQPHDTSAWSRHGGGVAKIEYTLPRAGRVRVRVFDVSGHEVAHPVSDEYQAAGPHFTLFAFGPSTRPQVFRYRVECGNRTRTGKITVEP